MTFAHIPCGYVLAYVNERLYPRKLPKRLFKQLMMVTVLGAVFPDLDTLPYLSSESGLVMHRQFITHTPFLYVLLTVVLLVFGTTFTKEAKRKLYLFWFAFVSGVLSHLITDSFVFGIRWLYPISNGYYSLFGSPFLVNNFSDLLRQYILSAYFLPEIVFFVLAVWLFTVKRYNRD